MRNIEGGNAGGIINDDCARAQSAELAFNDPVIDIIGLPFCC
jgi:hypothetical protein